MGGESNPTLGVAIQKSVEGDRAFLQFLSREGQCQVSESLMRKEAYQNQVSSEAKLL